MCPAAIDQLANNGGKQVSGHRFGISSCETNDQPGNTGWCVDNPDEGLATGGPPDIGPKVDVADYLIHHLTLPPAARTIHTESYRVIILTIDTDKCNSVPSCGVPGCFANINSSCVR